MASVEQLVAKLKELGGSANNPDLKAALGAKSGKEWDTLKQNALKSGVVVAGKGFGGRLILSDSSLVPQTPNSQRALVGSYGALEGKRLILMDVEGKPLGKPVKIGEIAVTADMVVAVVE